MFRIISQLKFCGVNITDEEMLEKTYSTLYTSNITLQQQYRLRGFKKYSELISSLLVAEKNNELLIKNHQSHPTGSAVFSEANTVFFKNYGQGYNHGSSHGCGRDRGRDRGCGRSGYYNPSQNNVIHKKHHVERHDKGKDVRESSLQNPKDSYYKCSSKGHGFKCIEHQSTFISFTSHP